MMKFDKFVKRSFEEWQSRRVILKNLPEGAGKVGNRTFIKVWNGQGDGYGEGGERIEVREGTEAEMLAKIIQCHPPGYRVRVASGAKTLRYEELFPTTDFIRRDGLGVMPYKVRSKAVIDA